MRFFICPLALLLHNLLPSESSWLLPDQEQEVDPNATYVFNQTQAFRPPTVKPVCIHAADVQWINPVACPDSTNTAGECIAPARILLRLSLGANGMSMGVNGAAQNEVAVEADAWLFNISTTERFMLWNLRAVYQGMEAKYTVSFAALADADGTAWSKFSPPSEPFTVRSNNWTETGYRGFGGVPVWSRLSVSEVVGGPMGSGGQSGVHNSTGTSTTSAHNGTIVRALPASEIEDGVLNCFQYRNGGRYAVDGAPSYATQINTWLNGGKAGPDGESEMWMKVSLASLVDTTAAPSTVEAVSLPKV
jgi:hypothetical protein